MAKQEIRRRNNVSEVMRKRDDITKQQVLKLRMGKVGHPFDLEARNVGTFVSICYNHYLIIFCATEIGKKNVILNFGKDFIYR